MNRRVFTEWGVPIAIALGGFVVAAWFGTSRWGLFFPDEVFQALEPAHKLVYGYGFETWESAYGGRNFTLNLLMAIPYAVMRAVGLDHPAWQLSVHRALFAGATALAAVGAWRLARVGGARRLWAAAACALVAWAPLQFALGFRTLTEVPAAALVVWGVAMVLDADVPETVSPADTTSSDDEDAPNVTIAEAWSYSPGFVIGICLLGLAVLIRLQMAFLVAGLLMTWRITGSTWRYRVAMRLMVGWALAYGLVDWIIFGVPFQSAGGYLRFHFILGGTTTYEGLNGPLFYPVVLAKTAGPAAILFLLSAVSWRRWRGPIVGAGLFTALHVLHAHRQVRFIWPVLPVLAGLGAVGAQMLQQRFADRFAHWSRRLSAVFAATLITATGLWSAWTTPTLTLRDLGQAKILETEPDTSAWAWRHDLNSLLFDAHEQRDLCGLRLITMSAVESGGYAFLHRDVPFYHALDFIQPDDPKDAAGPDDSRSPDGSTKDAQPPPDTENYNFVIVPVDADVPDEFRTIAQRGAWSLHHTGRPNCTPDPTHEPRVFRPAEMAGE